MSSNNNNHNRNNNSLILNYHDAVLYQSDLAILQSHNQWLNDACIHFFLTRLDQQLQQDRGIPCTNSNDYTINCKFIDPSVLSFFMHQWDEHDEDECHDDVLGLRLGADSNNNNNNNNNNTTRHVAMMLPMNDNYISRNWQTPGGGTHWTLLLVLLSYVYSDPHSNTNTAPSVTLPLQLPSGIKCWHFDSSHGSGNLRAAKAVTAKIQRVLTQWSRHDHSNINTNHNDCNDAKCEVQECPVPQQHNGYDCGLYTLATAEALARAFSNNNNNNNNNDNRIIQDPASITTETLQGIVKASVATTPSFCAKLRQRMAKDVQDLKIMAAATNSG